MCQPFCLLCSILTTIVIKRGGVERKREKMSHCKSFGKDKVIFATKEDHEMPSTVELPETERAPGLILPSGEINWNCPCLGGMATGPCGVEFREAFSCFHYR